MFLPLIQGQEAAKEAFRRAMASGRLAHAYLLIGPEGGGKRRFARELAKAFFCLEGRACGACPACSSVEHGNHPNVNVYGPAEGKTAVDIDTIRQMCERTHYRSTQLQVAILEQADLLNEPAANALLKTLEEPPGDILMILTTQSAGSLLPTIVSRCHRVFFARQSLERQPLWQEAQKALEDAVLPGFYAREDVKAWLSSAVPEEVSPRAALRRLLGALVGEWRAKLSGLGGSDLDDELRRLSAFLEFRQDIDRNVHADLILEKVLRTIRKG